MNYKEIATETVNNISTQPNLCRKQVSIIINKSIWTISKRIHTSYGRAKTSMNEENKKTIELPPALDSAKTVFPRAAVIAWVAEQLEKNS